MLLRGQLTGHLLSETGLYVWLLQHRKTMTSRVYQAPDQMVRINKQTIGLKGPDRQVEN